MLQKLIDGCHCDITPKKRDKALEESFCGGGSGGGGVSVEGIKKAFPGGVGYTEMVELFPEQEVTLVGNYQIAEYNFPFVLTMGDFVEVTVDGVLYSGKMAYLADTYMDDTLFLCDENGEMVPIPVRYADGYPPDPDYPGAFVADETGTAALITLSDSYDKIATVRVCALRDVPINEKYLPKTNEFVVTITEDMETGDLIADKSMDEVDDAYSKGQCLCMYHPWYGKLNCFQHFEVWDGFLWVRDFTIGENNVVTETVAKYALTPVTE